MESEFMAKRGGVTLPITPVQVSISSPWMKHFFLGFYNCS